PRGLAGLVMHPHLASAAERDVLGSELVETRELGEADGGADFVEERCRSNLGERAFAGEARTEQRRQMRRVDRLETGFRRQVGRFSRHERETLDELAE